LDLFADNRGLVYRLARRYSYIDPAVDLDDLTQAGYLGLIEAERTYDPSRGKSWANWAAYYIRRAMREAVGINSTRVRAHLHTVSLDEPLPGRDGEEGDTRGERLKDESLPAVDEQLLKDECRIAVREAVARLEPDEGEVIELHDLEGLTYEHVGERLGIPAKRAQQLRENAFRDLRRDKELMRAIDGETRFHAHKGVKAFLSDWTSVTEAAAMWRIEREQRLASRIRLGD